jgi:succinyl-CoA synthetase beta subunit
MRLYEFEAKKLFRKYMIPVPESVVISRDSFNELDKVVYPVVIKGQAFLGGRGKAGLVQFAECREEAEAMICSILGKKHGPFVIEKVLLEKKINIEREVYIAALIDRLEHKLLFMASKKGGVDIEAITKDDPGALLKYYFNPGEIMHGFKARTISGDLGFSSDGLGIVAGIILKVYKLFLGFDCKLVEINPLVLSKDGNIYALDAKIDLDEDAMFKHRELKEMGIVARHELGELTQREQIAKAKGIPYVDLDGDIGVFPGGAGFGIAAIDLITLYQGKPANFMDSGGAPTQEKLRAMLGLLVDNPKVKAIFGARFGGISRCDDWARAIVQYVKENKPEKPMIMRMAGNMEEQGRKILEQAKRNFPELFKKIKIYAVDTPIEQVIKETIRVAKTQIDTENPPEADTDCADKE